MKATITIFALFCAALVAMAQEAPSYYQMSGDMWLWAYETCKEHGGYKVLVITPEQTVKVYCNLDKVKDTYRGERPHD